MEAKREHMCKERVVDLEFKISRLGILGKAYYELAQIKLKRHRTQITIARTKNTLLHAALTSLREKDRIARKNCGDLENLRKTTASLRVTFDTQRNFVFKRQRKLEWQITGTHSAEVECAGVLDPSAPSDVRIRSLEQQLGLTGWKLKDTRILMKQYEMTVQPLRDEWIVYDSKLATLQTHVNMKTFECELLINTHHDAIRARDAAKYELEELLAFIEGYRRKALVSPDMKLKILRAIKEIKSVMDVGSMREMYHQFILQEKQSAYLEAIYEEMSKMVHQLKSDFRPTRKKSSQMEPGDVENMVDGTRMMVRRQSSINGSFSLLQLLDGTQKLVDKLHAGHITVKDHKSIEKQLLDQCRERLILILKALHRKLRHRNREAAQRAEFEAKERAHWEREEAEVARKHKAAEEARRKYEERTAAKELQEEAEREAREKEAELKALDTTPRTVREVEQQIPVTSGQPSNLTLETAPASDPESSSGGQEVVTGAQREPAATGTSTVIFLPKGLTEAKNEEGGQKGPASSDGPTEGPLPSQEDEAQTSEVSGAVLQPLPTSDTTAMREPETGLPVSAGQPDGNEPPRPSGAMPSSLEPSKDATPGLKETDPVCEQISPVDISEKLPPEALVPPSGTLALDASTQATTVTGSSQESVGPRSVEVGPLSHGIHSSAQGEKPGAGIPAIVAVSSTESTTTTASTTPVAPASVTESSTTKIAQPAFVSSPMIPSVGSPVASDPKTAVAVVDSSSTRPAPGEAPTLAVPSSAESVPLAREVTLSSGESSKAGSPAIESPRQPEGGSSVLVSSSSDNEGSPAQPRLSKIKVELSSLQPKAEQETSAASAPPIPARGSSPAVTLSTSESPTKPTEPTEPPQAHLSFDEKKDAKALTTESTPSSPLAQALAGAESLVLAPLSIETSAVSQADSQSPSLVVSPGDLSPDASAAKVITSREDHPAQTSAETELPVAAVVPISPSGIQSAPGAEDPSVQPTLRAESPSHRPGDARWPKSPNLLRSPSGAPVASGAKMPALDTDRLTRSPSPNLPRSSSGAPISTAVKFPLEPLSAQRLEGPRGTTAQPTVSGTPVPEGSGDPGGPSTPSPPAAIVLPTTPRGLPAPALSSPSGESEAVAAALPSTPSGPAAMELPSTSSGPADTGLPSTPSGPPVAVEVRLPEITSAAADEKNAQGPA